MTSNLTIVEIGSRFESQISQLKINIIQSHEVVSVSYSMPVTYAFLQL
jgi:hypothetical protein